jgi:hypothetical protein
VLLAGTLLGCGSPAQEPSAGSAAPSASPSATRAAAPSPSATATVAAPPVSVRISSLDLDEELVDLGIADDGTLEVPEDPDRVGWFTGGGRPGGTGPTVIVGHVDSTQGPAVFARLPDLEPGDDVVVTAADGARVEYVVEEVADVPQAPFPTEQVFGSTPSDVLRLITCTGPYDQDVGRYTENRIVTAVPRG